MRFGEDYELPSETPAAAGGARGSLVRFSAAASSGGGGKGALRGKVTFGGSSKALKGMLALKEKSGAEMGAEGTSTALVVAGRDGGAVAAAVEGPGCTALVSSALGGATPERGAKKQREQEQRSARQLEAAQEGADYDTEAGDEPGETLPDRLRARDRQKGVALVEAVRHFQSAEQKHAAEAEAEEGVEGEGEDEGGEGGGRRKGRKGESLRELKERELDEAHLYLLWLYLL